jgi:hypothetical protein
VPMKQRKASSGVQTIGSLRTLKLVLITIGQPSWHLSSAYRGRRISFFNKFSTWTKVEIYATSVAPVNEPPALRRY